MPDPQNPAPNPFAPPQAEVADVAEHGQLVLADRGVRLGAAILDGIFFMLIVYVPALLVGLLTVGAAAIRMRPGMPFVELLGAFAGALLAGLVGLAVYIWITIVLVNRNGQTLAKRLLDIKVVRKDGSRASLGRIFWLRNVVNMLFQMVPLIGSVYGLVDVLMIFSESRQCVHDRIADTIVVRA